MRRILKYLLYFVAACIIFVFATSLSIKLLLEDTSTTACPDIVGLDIDDAKMAAADKGLSVHIMKYERKKDVPYNRVLVQKPDPAMPVKAGRTIAVILSDGPRLIDVPSFVGMTLQEAQTALPRQNIKLKRIIYVPSDSQGKVLAQAPNSGQNILDEDGMTLIVGGREKRFYVMPDITTVDSRATLYEMEKKQIKYEVIGPRPEGYGRIVLASATLPRTIFSEDDVLEIRMTTGGSK
jgi:serine/threonine-protein kinase